MQTISDIETNNDIWQKLRPRTLDEVPGRSAVIRALKSRLRNQAHTMPMILYGPTGVGKLMIAKLYAKAVLCERADAAGLSCNQCDRCRSFDESQHDFVYLEKLEIDVHFDEAAEDMEEYEERLNAWASQLQSYLKNPPSWVSRRVIVLGQADRYPAKTFDVLLKAIEDLGDASDGKYARQTITTVIFLAEDLNRMRRAGRSRCLDYRIRRLNNGESRDLTTRLITDAGLHCDEAALSILVQAAEGLPGLVRQNVFEATRTGNITLESVRKSLELDWISETVDYWCELLADGNVHAANLRPRNDINLQKQVSRAKSVLYRLHSMLHIPQYSSHDIGFMYAHGDKMTALNNMFLSCSKVSGKTPQTLWRELARVWLINEITDELSFCEVGRLTNLVARRRNE